MTTRNDNLFKPSPDSVQERGYQPAPLKDIKEGYQPKPAQSTPTTPSNTPNQGSAGKK